MKITVWTQQQEQTKAQYNYQTLKLIHNNKTTNYNLVFRSEVKVHNSSGWASGSIAHGFVGLTRWPVRRVGRCDVLADEIIHSVSADTCFLQQTCWPAEACSCLTTPMVTVNEHQLQDELAKKKSTLQAEHYHNKIVTVLYAWNILPYKKDINFTINLILCFSLIKNLNALAKMTQGGILNTLIDEVLSLHAKSTMVSSKTCTMSLLFLLRMCSYFLFYSATHSLTHTQCQPYSICQQHGPAANRCDEW